MQKLRKRSAKAKSMSRKEGSSKEEGVVSWFLWTPLMASVFLRKQWRWDDRRMRIALLMRMK